MEPAANESDPEIVFAWCESCRRDVLTHGHFDADGPERRLCVHCDAELTSARRAVALSDLEAEGYSVLELEGCGKPDCGNGRCAR